MVLVSPSPHSQPALWLPLTVLFTHAEPVLGGCVAKKGSVPPAAPASLELYILLLSCSSIPTKSLHCYRCDLCSSVFSQFTRSLLGKFAFLHSLPSILSSLFFSKSYVPAKLSHPPLPGLLSFFIAYISFSSNMLSILSFLCIPGQDISSLKSEMFVRWPTLALRLVPGRRMCSINICWVTSCLSFMLLYTVAP